MRLNLDRVLLSVHHHRGLLLLLAITLLSQLSASPAAAQSTNAAVTETLTALASPAIDGRSPIAQPADTVRRVAANDKLSAATCQSLTARAAALSSFVFEDDFESGGTGRWQAPAQPTFSVRGVADLELAAELLGFSGEAVIHVTLTSPSGHAFQTLDAPVVVASGTATSPSAQSRTLPGYPYPVPVRFAAPATEGAALVATVPWPVAGTHVVHHGLYGTWTASAHLSASSPSGEQTITCPPSQFTLEP